MVESSLMTKRSHPEQYKDTTWVNNNRESRRRQCNGKTMTYICNGPENPKQIKQIEQH